MFTSAHGLHLIPAAGGEARRLTSADPLADRYADWSPNGSQIAFQRGNAGLLVFDIFVMNADGPDVRQLTNHPLDDSQPDWSPDGREIVFSSHRDNTGDLLRDSTRELYIMNADGTNVRRVTQDHHSNTWPAWSPDGTRIAFSSSRESPHPDKRTGRDLFVINVDGTNLQRLTTTGIEEGDTHPTWSPDGKQIAFQRQLAGDRTHNMEIFVMDADGSNQRNITNDPADDLDPDWLWPGPVSSLTPVGKLLDIWGTIKQPAPPLE